MITIITGELCPACTNLIKALEMKGINFSTHHKDSDFGKKQMKKYGVASIPFTVCKAGVVETLHIGFSSSVVESITNFAKNVNE